jgi:transcription antitermination factor NusG
MADWLVARLITNAERAVTDSLAMRDTESYWPRFQESVRDKRTHRKRIVTRPLFPCYLFIRPIQSFYSLLEVTGIIGIIMRGACPAMSDRLDREIERIRSSELDGFVPKPVVATTPKIQVGNRVVILSGILHGQLGLCCELRGTRAKIITNMFGGDTPVWHSERDLAVA